MKVFSFFFSKIFIALYNKRSHENSDFVVIMDFINGNIISLKDLDTIDGTIQEVERLLNEKRQQVKAKVESKTGTFDDEITTLLVGDIIEEVEKVRISSNADEALEKVKELKETYNELKVFDELIELYEHKRQAVTTDKFVEQGEWIMSTIMNNDGGDVQQLEKINEEIGSLDPSMTAPHIYNEVVLCLYEELHSQIHTVRTQLEAKLQHQLHSIDWLGSKFKVEMLSNEFISKTNPIICQLIALQGINNTPIYPDTWWAIDILLLPIITRFNYHFNSNKDTNKLSRPEWAFEFIEEFLSKNIKTLELVIGSGFRSCKKIMIYQIITSLLVPVRAKTLHTINVINETIEKSNDNITNYDKSGRLLSHLIFELASFDQRFRNIYKYNPYIDDMTKVPTKKWMGLTGDILLQGDKERQGASNWLKFESRLANNRFSSEILDDPNGMKIDIDFHDHEDQNKHEEITEVINQNLKPTYSAYNLTKLFDNLTSHYKTIHLVKFQLKYFSTIQLRLIDRYYEHLKQNLKQFDESYNLLKVLSFIPGALDNNDQNTDANNNSLKGLEILTQIFCLARYIHEHLQNWSGELIFVQLWNAYKHAATNKDYDEFLSVFDTAIDQYGKLIHDINSRYDSFFKKGIKNYLKTFVNTSQWDIKESTDHSQDFLSLITSLPIFLRNLQRWISVADYYLIVDNVVSSICSLWYEYIITNNRFTKVGTQQLKRDFNFIFSQLGDELWLKNSEVYSTAHNYDYLKVKHSIDILERFDSVLAKNMLSKFSGDKIRNEFESLNLTDSEIRELLHRIL